MLLYVARGKIEGWCDQISNKVKLGGLDSNNVVHTKALDMKYYKDILIFKFEKPIVFTTW